MILELVSNHGISIKNSMLYIDSQQKGETFCAKRHRPHRSNLVIIYYIYIIPGHSYILFPTHHGSGGVHRGLYAASKILRHRDKFLRSSRRRRHFFVTCVRETSSFRLHFEVAAAAVWAGRTCPVFGFAPPHPHRSHQLYIRSFWHIFFLPTKFVLFTPGSWSVPKYNKDHTCWWSAKC